MSIKFLHSKQNLTSHNQHLYSFEILKDKMYVNLMSIMIEGKRKYENKAQYLIYRIPVYRPTPYFIINQSDLHYSLVRELVSLNDIHLDKLIKEVISHIFESINKNYFLLSIKKYNLLRWKIDP